MKNEKAKAVIKRIFYVILVLAFALLVCVGVYAYSLMNNPDYITIGVGEEYTLTPNSDDYIVRSYNANVITPKTGSTVTANAVGDAIVGIKYSYFNRDFYRIKVIDAPDTVKLNRNDYHLGVKESITLIATCSVGTHEFPLTFSSSDETVATVNNIGTVTAVNVGECEIYASAYNGAKATCKLTVSKAPSKFSLTQTSLILGEGEEYTLDPVFDENEYSSSIELICSDEEIVSANSNKIIAKKSGECTVFARSHNGKTAQCSVTVKTMPEKIELLTLDKYDIDTDINLNIDMGKDSACNGIEVAVSDPDILEIDKDDMMLIHPKKKGKATITVTLSNGVSAEKSVTIGDYSKSSISFKILNQYPTLPTGCEVVSLTSVLNHYGFDVSMTTMADEYMPRYEGSYLNVSPHDYFLGTPYSRNGFGCFSGCIVKTAQNFFEDKNTDDYVAVDISGCSADELYNYLNNDVPVITWVTSGFADPFVSSTWTVNGETVTWCNYEHCLVTTGYDKNAGTVTVGDDSGGYSYSVSMSQYEKVFKGMGSMAVAIIKK